MDYASLNPGPSRIEYGNDSNYDRILNEGIGCRSVYGYWGTTTNGNQHNPKPSTALGSRYAPFNGVIVRSSHMVSRDDGSVIDLKYTPITKARKIKDGLSKTSMISEKWVALGTQHAAYDDRGWSDGWDLDTVSSTFCQPVHDADKEVINGAISAGSRHTGGVNVVFADDSVRFINYDVDLEVWNLMAHRADGQVYESP
jgi:prepilin-type processing-associated H-X9-DG protein